MAREPDKAAGLCGNDGFGVTLVLGGKRLLERRPQSLTAPLRTEPGPLRDEPPQLLPRAPAILAGPPHDERCPERNGLRVVMVAPPPAGGGEFEIVLVGPDEPATE